MAPAAQQPISYVQTGGGVSWGRNNINIEGISQYYKNLQSLVNNGAKLWSSMKTLELERTKWEWERQKAREAEKQASIDRMMAMGQLHFGVPPIIPMGYGMRPTP